MIVGKIIAARVKPPERIDHPMLRVMTKKTNPKSPKMMDGIPARQSVPNRMRRLIRLSRVYSLKKIAVPTPKGVAKMIATTVKASVPMMVEKSPPARKKNGKGVKKQNNEEEDHPWGKEGLPMVTRGITHFNTDVCG